MPKLPSVLLVEDQQLLRLGLRVALEGQNCCNVVGEAGDGEAALRETHRLRPEIVLMDVGLPKVDGIEATWKIKQDSPHTRVVMFTSRTDPDAVSSAFGAGADAYCAKDAPVEQVANAISAVMRGEVWLDPAIADVVVSAHSVKNSTYSDMSDKELQILALIRAEMDNRQIADRLNTNPETIVRMMHNIITRFVNGGAEPVEDRDEQKQRERLNQWLTAFADNMEEGTTFCEKYLVREMIGSGGLGAVFKARHLYMDRTVALKLLRPDVSEDRLAMRSFQREAMAIANVQHKNIVSVYDFGISDNHEPYLIMEYVDGTDLANIISKEHRLTPSRTIELAKQICDGLSEAHDKGIIHCDLKPSNILILGQAPNETVKLVDFGLVQLMPRDTSSPQMQMTDKYFICGTPAYMSPEQCAGKSLDARSDVYALGCVLFEALTGQLVFTGSTPMEVFSKQMLEPPPSLNAACDVQLPPELELLVARMLSKDPAARPASMDEVHRKLRAIAT